MSRPRFLADHDFDERTLEGIERKEPAIEIVRVRDVGLDQAPDDVVLAFAAREHWLVLSHDINTMPAAAIRRLNNRETVTGLFLAHQRKPRRAVINSVFLIWSASEMEEWENRIEYLPY